MYNVFQNVHNQCQLPTLVPVRWSQPSRFHLSKMSGKMTYKAFVLLWRSKWKLSIASIIPFVVTKKSVAVVLPHELCYEQSKSYHFMPCLHVFCTALTLAQLPDMILLSSAFQSDTQVLAACIRCFGVCFLLFLSLDINIKAGGSFFLLLVRSWRSDASRFCWSWSRVGRLYHYWLDEHWMLIGYSVGGKGTSVIQVFFFS